MTRFALALGLVLALAVGARAEEHSSPEDQGTSHAAAHGEGHGHGGVQPGSMKPFWLMFAIQVVGFLCLVFVLAKFAGPMVRKGMDDRRAKFAQTYENLRKETGEVERLVREFRDKLANIDREARARLERALAEAAHLRAEMVAEGKAAADDLAAKAKREVELETGIAIAEVKLEVIERAVLAARGALAKGVSPDVQRALVNGAIDEIDSLREVTVA